MAESHVAPAPSRRSQRARQRAETHERLYRAAVEEFRTFGYADAQIPRIAQAAGVVRGTFYFHFPSKEHVLRELVDRVQGEIAAELETLAEQRLPATGWMTQLVEIIGRMDESLAQADLIRDVIVLHIREDRADEPRPTALAIRAALARAIAGSYAKGELREGLDPDAAAGIILSSIFGVMAAPRDGGAGRRTELTQLVELLLSGLLARPAER